MLWPSNPLLGVAFLIWAIRYTYAVDVKGSIAWNFVCPDSLHPQTQVILDAGRYKAGVRKDGSFIIHDVAPGSYLLQVLARDHIFDQVCLFLSLLWVFVCIPECYGTAGPSRRAHPRTRIVVFPNNNNSGNWRVSDASQIVEIRPVPPGTHFSPFPPNPLLPYPLVLSAHARKVYFVPHEGFNIVEMFKNPMMLMMVLAAFLILVLPKAMEGMDPDLVKDMKDTQGRMLNMQNQLQSGDYAGLATGLLASGEAPNSSSGTTSSRIGGGPVGAALPPRGNVSPSTGPGKRGPGGGGGGGGKKRR
ncbi:hypothetical protein BS47DRAFT_1143256 [Hydnum rufescens UP504]|uniref:ER membrane protein complex subunit 7 beta-sandwich domain-containing protein n=1 Tax=Hydnum rufescens UP504 TaxID=1448309 RepID=A0A9P6AUG9_9AGAM|nr:hypothetical protein BS47DRAFT_1143256 [Hydnum rufescens UP504]